jgi:protein-S-isoprenylcysteine O-methyltransferase Ste14
MTPFEWTFLVEFVALMGLRFWYGRRMRAQRVVVRRLDILERVLLLSTLVGMTILPVIYLATPWLAFADYTPARWQGWLGAAAAVAAVFLFWRSHADLGTNWSPTLEIRAEHKIVSHGVYRTLRHPMYAAIWLWAASQFLLLPNWVAGLAGVASFGPMYFLRVPREEQMLVERFGADYRDYMARTGRVLPRLIRR